MIARIVVINSDKRCRHGNTQDDGNAYDPQDGYGNLMETYVEKEKK